MDMQEKFDIHNENMRQHRINLEKDIEILVGDRYTQDEKAFVRRMHMERIEMQNNLSGFLNKKE